MTSLCAYNVLISYVCSLSDEKKTAISKGNIVDDLKDKLHCNKDTIKRKVEETRFTEDELLNIIIYFKETATSFESCNKVVLYELLKDFIESVVKNSNVVEGYMKEVCDLVSAHASSSGSLVKIPKIITNYHFNNRLGIKREYVCSKIQKHELYDVFILRGIRHSGKSAFLEWFINNPQINDRCFNVRFMYNGTDFETSAILADIISRFTDKDTGSSTLTEMEGDIKKYFGEYENVLIIVDDVDEVDMESLERFFESFSKIKNSTLCRVTFLLTCQTAVSNITSILQQKGFLSTVINMPQEINADEWNNFVNQLAMNEPKIKDIIEEDAVLVQWIFDAAPEKELTVLQQILYYFLKRIKAGATINLIKIGLKELIEADDRTLFDVSEAENIFNGMTKDAQTILIAFTLVDFSTTISVIYKLTHIHGLFIDGAPLEDSALDHAIDEIQCQLLLHERPQKNDDRYFTISYYMKEYLNRRITSLLNFGTEVVSAFADYCIETTKPLDMCFDNLELLNALDVENSPEDINIDVIKKLLSLCELHELWEKFYHLSRNTRYYFFKRRKSLSGRKSIHYRRAIAGKKMNDPQNEFEALLYFCNICSKTKEYDASDDALERLAKLYDDHETSISYDLKCKYHYVLGLFRFSKDDFEGAKPNFQKCIEMMDECYHLTRIKKDKNLYYDYLTAKRWYCDCICRLAENGSAAACAVIDMMEQLLDEVEKGSQEINFVRAVTHAKLIRGRIYKLLPEKHDKLLAIIEQLHEYEMTINNDKYYQTQYDSILAFLNQ